MKLKTCISLLLLLTIAATIADTLTVHVATEGPREGVIAILVFKTKKGFPNKPDKAFLKARFPVTAEGPVECVITNLPYGTYALSLLHDINDNYKADKMLGFGPPKEPVGFSNFNKKVLKKPKFESTLIHFNAETNEVSASVWYIL
jgi:uncharacterized protein (DUF2141 family)